MSIVRSQRVIEDRVHTVEFNRRTRSNGTITDQVIFWDYYGDEEHVVDARPGDEVLGVSHGRRGNRRFVEFTDTRGGQHTRRRVFHLGLTRTATEHDPELNDMQFVTISDRRRLTAAD